MPRKSPGGASSWVDPDDAPALTEEHFRRADVYEGDRLVRRGRPPVGAEPKLAVKLRLPRHVIEVFKAGGPGWQTRISNTLEAVIVMDEQDGAAPGIVASKPERRAAAGVYRDPKGGWIARTKEGLIEPPAKAGPAKGRRPAVR
jgi:uncharacterized protein (DUF4415 family)